MLKHFLRFLTSYNRPNTNLFCLDEHGFEYTKHRLVCHNIIPRVLRRDEALHIPEFIIEEECWYDEKGQKFWARTRNLSWSEIATLSNIITLSMTPNPSW